MGSLGGMQAPTQAMSPIASYGDYAASETARRQAALPQPPAQSLLSLITGNPNWPLPPPPPPPPPAAALFNPFLNPFGRMTTGAAGGGVGTGGASGSPGSSGGPGAGPGGGSTGATGGPAGAG